MIICKSYKVISNSYFTINGIPKNGETERTSVSFIVHITLKSNYSVKKMVNEAKESDVFSFGVKQTH